MLIADLQSKRVLVSLFPAHLSSEKGAHALHLFHNNIFVILQAYLRK